MYSREELPQLNINFGGMPTTLNDIVVKTHQKYLAIMILNVRTLNENDTCL